MMQPDNPITEQDLHAYIDGQLDETRRAQVEEYLQNNPEVASKYRDFAAYNQGLHELFDHTLREPVPDQFNKQQSKGSGLILRRAAAMLSALIIGSVFGWISRGTVESTQHSSMAMVNDAFASYAVYTPEIRHPVEVTHDQEQHLFSWLSKRINADVRAPDLQSLGYELLGGRLLSSEGKPAALFMYENPQGQRIVLFTRHKKNSETQTAFRFASRDNIKGFYWIDGDLGYALIGDIGKDSISNAAHVVYQELNR